MYTKSKRCIFIRYRVDDLGYRFWDYDNHKIIRSWDVVFNEKVMYKYKLQKKKDDFKYIIFDEINEKNIPKVQVNIQHKESKTPSSDVRISIRISIPSIYYSQVLYYVLYINFDELETFKEAMKMGTSKKWNLGMDEEMESLM